MPVGSPADGGGPGDPRRRVIDTPFTTQPERTLRQLEQVVELVYRNPELSAPQIEAEAVYRDSERRTRSEGAKKFAPETARVKSSRRSWIPSPAVPNIRASIRSGMARSRV